MEEIHYEIFNTANTTHKAAADVLQTWTASEHMIPLSFQKISSHLLGVLAFTGKDNELLGYRAVTESYDNGNWLEIGGIVIDPTKRGRGLGQIVANTQFQLAKETYPSSNFVIFANPTSIRISQNQGFEVVSSISDVPSEALDLCKQECKQFTSACRMGRICCDEILVYHQK